MDLAVPRIVRRTSIRIRLAIWYILALAIILITAGSFLYFSLSSSLASGLDSDLHLRAEQIAAGIREVDDQVVITRRLLADLPGGRQGISQQKGDPSAFDNLSLPTFGDDALIAIVDRESTIVYESPAFAALLVPDSMVFSALHGHTAQLTVAARGMAPARIYAYPLHRPVDGQIYGVVIVGQSLQEVRHTLRSLLLTMGLMMPVALALAALGGWFLAARALAPIDRLTQAARHIGAEDLHRRLPEPESHDEVGRLARTLNEFLARMATAMDHQRRFIADASHELRTPIAVLKSNIEVARQRPRSVAEYEALLANLDDEVRRMSVLVSELLALARADAHELHLDLEDLILSDLARDVVEQLEEWAASRNIALRTIMETDVVPWVRGDAARLLQLLLNLTDNAINYTPPGGQVTLAVGCIVDRAYVAVSDTGIGIQPEHLPHLFERFYRVDKARSRAQGGTGLGLAIADTIARAHGGEITVISEPGCGSTFTLWLPLAPIDRRSLASKVASD
jgi:heavy metal sensor kinase